VTVPANMGLRLRSEICKDILTFLEKETAYSFLLALISFMLLCTHTKGPMLNALSFSFVSAVLGSSAACRYQPKHHLARQRRPTCPSGTGWEDTRYTLENLSMMWRAGHVEEQSRSHTPNTRFGQPQEALLDK